MAGTITGAHVHRLGAGNVDMGGDRHCSLQGVFGQPGVEFHTAIRSTEDMNLAQQDFRMAGQRHIVLADHFDARSHR